MATMHVALVRITGRAGTGATMPVANSVVVGAKTLTAFAASTDSTLAAPATGWEGLFWLLTGDVAAFSNFGAGPPAAGADSGHYSVAGAPLCVAVSAANEKCAVKAAA